MEYGKISIPIAGTAKGEKIFPTLHIHFLLKNHYTLIPCVCVFHIHTFIHSVGSCDLSSLNILERESHNRLLNAFMKMNAHFNLKFRPLLDRVGLKSLGIHYNEVCDLSLFFPILQCVRVHKESLFPVFFLCL